MLVCNQEPAIYEYTSQITMPPRKPFFTYSSNKKGTLYGAAEFILLRLIRFNNHLELFCETFYGSRIYLSTDFRLTQTKSAIF